MYEKAIGFINRGTKELDFPPTRMTTVDKGTTILSWMVHGKYGEMEVHPNGTIYAWTSFETGEPKTWLVAIPMNGGDYADTLYYKDIRAGLVELQDFVE